MTYLRLVPDDEQRPQVLDRDSLGAHRVLLDGRLYVLDVIEKTDDRTLIWVGNMFNHEANVLRRHQQGRWFCSLDGEWACEHIRLAALVLGYTPWGADPQ